MHNRFLYGLFLLCLAFRCDLSFSQENKKSSVNSYLDSLQKGNDAQINSYGFRSLFSQQEFPAKFPFNHSIHPEAWGFIHDYLQKNQKNLTQMKTWALPYFTLIENIMSQYNLPKELKYLAVIESGLNTQAISWAGARGPWQFMPETAKEFGLEVSRWNDERTDYFRSTHAAAKLLSSLYNEYKDWLLVIAAYNGGAGRVNSAMKKSGSKDFWKLQHYLPEESKIHVKKFIATHYIMEGNKSAEKKSMNLRTDSSEAGISVQEIAGKFSSVVMAKHLLLDLNYFNFLNPGFDQVLSENKIYMLKLPSDKMEKFNINRYAILSESIQILLRFYGNDNTQRDFPEISEVPERKKKRPLKKN